MRTPGLFGGFLAGVCARWVGSEPVDHGQLRERGLYNNSGAAHAARGEGVSPRAGRVARHYDLLLCPPNSTCVHVAALRAVSFALLIAVVYVGACVDGCRRSCRRPVSAVGLAADAAVMSATALELPHCPGVPPCRHSFTPLT